jgi:hypothetical protein
MGGLTDQVLKEAGKSRKFEARNPKSEINSNYRNKKIQNELKIRLIRSTLRSIPVRQAHPSSPLRMKKVI